MKKLYYFLPVFIFLNAFNLYAQSLKPYVIGFESNSSTKDLSTKLRSNLESAGIEVIGAYSPAEKSDRSVLVITSEDLLDAVKKVKGLTGFASSLRVAITLEGDKFIVSYTNPLYWGNAYFRDDFPKVEHYYKTFTTKIEQAMRETGQYDGKEFGSEEGVEIDDLRKYRYMFGMPRFDDPVELNDLGSYDDAIAKIDANLSKGIPNIKQVYAIEVPNSKIKLYGFALEGEKGEAEFLPKIDITNPRHTAFLPYEMLVLDGKVYMLHGRYRIALSFPDLSMGTFTKIMSTPGDIKDMLQQVAE